MSCISRSPAFRRFVEHSPDAMKIEMVFYAKTPPSLCFYGRKVILQRGGVRQVSPVGLLLNCDFVESCFQGSSGCVHSLGTTFLHLLPRMTREDLDRGRAILPRASSGSKICANQCGKTRRGQDRSFGDLSGRAGNAMSGGDVWLEQATKCIEVVGLSSFRAHPHRAQ